MKAPNWLSVVVCAALIVPAANAHAQSADAPPTTTTPAPSAPAANIPEEARKNFEAGVALLQDPAKPRYEEAYGRFKAAYAAYPNPRILGNIALCAMKLERDLEAIEAYEKYAKDGDLAAEERAQVERDLLTLRTGLTRIVVTSNPPGAAIVDTRVTTTGEDITNSYGTLDGRVELGVRQGHHVLRARMTDGRELTHEFDARGGSAAPHEFDFTKLEIARRAEPEGPRPRPVPTSVYAGAGITALLAVGTAVTGLVAVKNAGDYDTANNGVTPERANDLRDRTQTLNTVTDVLLIGTVVAAGVTTFLYFTRPEAPRRAAFNRAFLTF